MVSVSALTCNEEDTIYLYVTDNNGCTSSDTAIFVVGDNINPIITGVIPNDTVTCSDLVQAPAANSADLLALMVDDGAPTELSDNCTSFAGLQITSVTDAISGVCHHEYNRTYTVTDSCANFATISQIIVVNDNVNPVIDGTLPSDTVTCVADITPAVTTIADLQALLQEANALISDNCTNFEIGRAS